MAKNKLERLLKQFETGDYDPNALKEIDVEIDEVKSVYLMPIESSLFRQFEAYAKEKKTTAEKLLKDLMKKSILKAA